MPRTPSSRPPALRELHLQDRARLLAVIVRGSTASVAVGLLVFLALQEFWTASALLVCFVGLLLIRWVATRKYSHLASWLLVLQSHGLIVFLLIRGAGLRDEAALLYPLTLIIASLVLPSSGYIGYVALAIVSSGAVTWASRVGWIRTSSDSAGSVLLFVSVAVILCATALVVRWLTDSMRASLYRAWRHEESLKESNRELARQSRRVRSSKARWQSLVETAPDIILSVDRAGSIVFSNTPVPAGDPIPGDLYDLIRPEDHAKVRQAFERAFSDGEQHSFECRGLATTYPARQPRDEHTAAPGLTGPTSSVDVGRFQRWYSCRLKPIIPSQEDSEPTSRATLIGTDVTAERELTAERERLLQELEARNSELERFTYTVSHDLKSPLITIRGFLGFVERHAESGDMDRLREDMARIRKATDSMQNLLEDLLDLSRVGRVTSEPIVAPFGEIVDEALVAVHGLSTRAQVEVVVQAGLPSVSVDRSRLVEVVQNLVENAIKFAKQDGNARVEIGVETRPMGPVFFVRDHGIGIDPEYQDRVFDLFERLNPELDGTGIGLSLVRRIIEVHGGKIWVESEGEGHGSTFLFTLPIHSVSGRERPQ